MTRLFVDDRYRGAHGIGRYASEVLGRLDLPWHALGLGGTPSGPIDAFRALPGIGRGDLLYSPGYGALVRAPRQILTVHDLIHLQTPWPGRAKFVAYYNGPVRSVVRRAGVVLTVSETSARAIRAWVRDDAVEVIDAGNGCSAAFTPDGPAETSDAPYAVYVGNTRRHKNLDVVLRALAAVPELRLVTLVPAGEVGAVEDRARSLGIADRIDVRHGVDDDALARLYRGAVATVMPSTLEGFGLPALESVACGTPVLHWRGCAAVAEIVGDRGTAMDVADDVGAWAEALRDAVQHPRRVEPPAPGRYDWARTARVVSETLASALA